MGPTSNIILRPCSVFVSANFSTMYQIKRKVVLEIIGKNKNLDASVADIFGVLGINSDDVTPEEIKRLKAPLSSSKQKSRQEILKLRKNTKCSLDLVRNCVSLNTNVQSQSVRLLTYNNFIRLKNITSV